MSRKDDIDLMLSSIQEDYSSLFDLYNASLSKKTIDPKLSLKIKSYLENARSILDYSAREIADRIGVSKEHKVYFPLVEKEKNIDSFRGAVGRNLPDLENKNKAAFDFIEKLQPYHSGNEWIGQLVELVNVHKHEALLPQKRNESERITSNHNAGGSVSWDPSAVKFGSGVYINGAPVNPFTQMPVPTPSTTVTREIWVDFVFDDGNNVSVISLVRNIKEKLAGIIENIYKLI